MQDLEYECHSLEQVAFIQQLSKRADLEARQALYLATQLVNHGFPNTHGFLLRLDREIPSTPARNYLNRLKKRNKAIQALPALSGLREDPQIVQQLYQRDGFVFRPGSHRRHIAVVVFTTKFNNFTFSNLVIDAIFAELGVSRLILKDTSEFLYFRGVKDLADCLTELPHAINQFLECQGIRNAILTGYSSGGYPSLYVASRLRNIGYVGYSIFTNICPGTPLPMPAMYEKLLDRVDKSLFRDLKLELDESKASPYLIHYGQRAPIDRAHAEYLRGCKNVRVVCHESSGHEVTTHMLENAQFTVPFVKLLETRPFK